MGMYTSHSKWIKKEIDGAKNYKKPILGVNPWGQERKSGIVQENADYIVGWNQKVIIEGIWDLYNKGNGSKPVGELSDISRGFAGMFGRNK